MIHLISDTHFSHENIKKYCSRPDDWEQKTISNWNRIIKPEDEVVHLGDFAFGPIENVTKYVEQLNGRKHIVIGNHDIKKDKRFPYETLGFTTVFRKHRDWVVLNDGERKYRFINIIRPIEMGELEFNWPKDEKLIFISHRPVEATIVPYYHGHTHNGGTPFDNNIYYDLNKIPGRNLCIEMTNYEPIAIRALLGDQEWMQKNLKIIPRSKDD